MTDDPASEWQSGYDAGIEAQAAEIERLRDFVIYAAETSEDEHISRKAFNVLGDAND
jgi:hypothetical protein